MGKNNGNSWLNAVKKAFRSPVKDSDEKRSSRRREEEIEHEEEEKKRGKRRWIFRKAFPLETTIQHNATKSADRPTASTISTNSKSGENMLKKHEKKQENSVTEQKSAIAMAVATTAAAEAAVATAQAAVEIIRLSTGRSSFMFKEHRAALVIQSVFRGYLARRALLALKGVVKLQALIRGHNVRRRTKMTLQCIQSLVRVQAQVCDQRRRLSCENTTSALGSMFSRKSISRTEGNHHSNDFDDHPPTLEEIQALINEAKECSIRNGKTLAHVLSQQMWESDGDQCSDVDYKEQKRSCKRTINQWDRKDRALCNQRDPIKTVEIDTSRPYNSDKSHHSDHEQYLDPQIISSPHHKKHNNIRFYSPKTSSSSKIKSVYVNSPSPQYQVEERNYHTAETPTLRSNNFHRMSMSENSCPIPRPNYMAATASAMARLRSQSTPRQRPMSPCREPTSSARKRLSFPFNDGRNEEDNLSCRSYKSIRAREVEFKERSSCYTE